jgi:hypothetical protein
VGIFWDYPLKTRSSKQSIEKIPEYGIIPSNTLEVNKASQRSTDPRISCCPQGSVRFAMATEVHNILSKKVSPNLHVSAKDM